jgi:hypothetical protein
MSIPFLDDDFCSACMVWFLVSPVMHARHANKRVAHKLANPPDITHARSTLALRASRKQLRSCVVSILIHQKHIDL